jgi:hypothetical protein
MVDQGDVDGPSAWQVTGGAATVLWEEAGPFSAGTDHVFTLDCVGAGLSGYLDGQRPQGLVIASSPDAPEPLTAIGPRLAQYRRTSPTAAPGTPEGEDSTPRF